MMLSKIGLVLEGGGMRGMYTAGALDAFLKSDVHFPYVIGVSAGAVFGASYISEQYERTKNVVMTYINDPRYLSFRNLLREGNLFSRKFSYDTIPHQLIPFDFHVFRHSPTRFVTGTTDCRTGKPVYFEKDTEDILAVAAASAALPFFSKVVEYSGYELLDGGISDPIPIRKAIADGHEKNIIILTRPRGYRKKPFMSRTVVKMIYHRYPHIAQALLSLHERYNATMDHIDRLEQAGKVLILRPSHALPIARLERNVKRLSSIYDQGFADARKVIPQLSSSVQVPFAE